MASPPVPSRRPGAGTSPSPSPLDAARTTASWLTADNQDRSRRVLVEGDEALNGARLALIDSVRNTLQHGLGLLGVRAPRAM
ncbi:MAG: hypothetical protein IPG45_15780 [Deltaproteobacteria bacterium]|nr:hypothetical protein [Deltaproteobacteria bacterium]